MTRRFVGGRSQIDIRELRREYGKAALAGNVVSLRWGDRVETVELVRSARRFGGWESYFICGRCERRACILYLVRDRLACRRCHRMAHWSEAITPMQRRVRRLVRLRERMGQPAGGNAIGPLPDKPKWMRWRTYDRLAAELARREREHFASPIAPMILARITRALP